LVSRSESCGKDDGKVLLVFRKLIKEIKKSRRGNGGTHPDQIYGKSAVITRGNSAG
jgi:hypothetical protein